MNLKIRFAIWFSVLVSVILLISFCIIYYLADDFRKQDFYLRLRQKSLTTHHFLVKVAEIDRQLLRIIDRNNLNVLSEQKILIFDSDFSLVYSNIEDDTISYDKALLQTIKAKKEIKITDKRNYDILGLWEEEGEGEASIILASAYDNHGHNQLAYLKNVLIITWIMGFMLTIYIAYWYVKRIISKPIVKLSENVAAIGFHNLEQRIEVPKNQDELTSLAESFNEMLERLEKTIAAQRTFLKYASHELRTPLANMLAMTENALSLNRNTHNYQQILASLKEEQGRLIDLTNSLLLVSRFESLKLPPDAPQLRIDEVIYNTIEEIKAISPQYNIKLDFCNHLTDENVLVLRGNEMLLKTAFRNLIENACKYSDDKSAHLVVCSSQKKLQIECSNNGQIINEQEQKMLFTHFFRGENSAGKRGSGLGLVIAQRIFAMHQAQVFYHFSDKTINIFTIVFSPKL